MICGSRRITGCWIPRAPMKGFWWHLHVGSSLIHFLIFFIILITRWARTCSYGANIHQGHNSTNLPFPTGVSYRHRSWIHHSSSLYLCFGRAITCLFINSFSSFSRFLSLVHTGLTVINFRWNDSMSIILVYSWSFFIHFHWHSSVKSLHNNMWIAVDISWIKDYWNSNRFSQDIA